MDNTLIAQLENIAGSLLFALPELWLAFVFLLLVLLDLFRSERLTLLLPYLLLLALLGNLFLIYFNYSLIAEAKSSPHLFLHLLTADGLAHLFKYIFTLAGILAVIIVLYSRSLFAQLPDTPQWPLIDQQGRGEFLVILTGMLLAMHLLAMAANLLMIYLALEMLSVGAYVLAAFRLHRKSVEAGIKYILFGAFASALMLYGMSMLYGFSGSLEVKSIAEKITGLPAFPVLLALVLTFSGFLFKISAAPFHIWTPDVYEGAPTPVVAFFSVAPKAAGLVVLARLLYELLTVTALHDFISSLLAVVALASIVVGNFSALWQGDAKRMLAYSSVAHAGFMLVGLTAASPLGLQSTAFYMACYLFINMGTFLMLIFMEDQLHSDRISGFKGLGQRSPWLGVAMLIAMIALVGLPPTAGFTAKLMVFTALWESWRLSQNPLELLLLFGGLLSTVLSLYFYLKIPFFMFFRSPEDDKAPFTLSIMQKAAILLFILPVLLFFFKSDLLWKEIAALLPG